MPTIPQMAMAARPMPRPVKQITYPNVAIDVQPLPENNRMLVITELDVAGMPTLMHLFPMPAEYAHGVGQKLMAPHIIAASGHGG